MGGEDLTSGSLGKLKTGPMGPTPAVDSGIWEQFAKAKAAGFQIESGLWGQGLKSRAS